MTDVKTAIGFAHTGNAVEFNKSVEDMLNQRAVDAIAQRRDDIAQTVFNAATEEDVSAEVFDDEQLDDMVTPEEVDELDQEEPEEE